MKRPQLTFFTVQEAENIDWGSNRAHNIMETETWFFIIPTRFLAPLDCSKIPALDLETDANNIKSRKGSRAFQEKWNRACPGATENLRNIPLS